MQGKDDNAKKFITFTRHCSQTKKFLKIKEKKSVIDFVRKVSLLDSVTLLFSLFPLILSLRRILVKLFFQFIF